MSYTIYLQKEKKKRWKRAYETFLAASSNYFRKKLRERLNALKWLFLTFALLSHWNSTNSFFRVFNFVCQTRHGRKALWWQSLSVWSSRHFWKGMWAWNPLDRRKKTKIKVFLTLFSATGWPWYSVFSWSAASARSVFCLLWCISVQTARC